MKFPAQIQRLAFSVQRLVFVVILLTTYYLLLTTSAFAQAPNPYAAPNTNPNVPNNLHTWTQNVIIEVMAAATCQLAGVDPVNPNQKCLGVDPQTNSIGFVPSTSSGQVGGAIGVMSNFIAMTFTPPLHTGDYFSYLAQNFGIAKPAYAQGVGFQGLKPLMDLWIAFRNIVYLAFVLVFVIIGVAIMLRVKIDPRTVMTIENQIPKIIIGLLLVTFSFAIAGLLIDLMYVSIYLTTNVVSSAAPKVITPDISERLIRSTHPLDAVNIVGGAKGEKGILPDIGGLTGIAWKPAEGIGGFVAPMFDSPPGRLTVGIVTGIITRLGAQATGADKILDKIFTTLGFALGAPAGPVGALIGTTVGAIVASLIGGAVGTIAAPELMGGIANLIAFLIIIVALLWALFRLWFELLKAYIFILLDVVLAPFFVVLGLFPGSPIGFGTWMRDILANLSAFPVVIAMLLLGRVFMSAFGRNEPNQFAPPLIGNPADTSVFGALIGLGIILMTPQVVAMMKEVFKAPQFKYGAAIGQGIGVGPAILGGVITAAVSPFGALAMLGRGRDILGGLKKGVGEALNVAGGKATTATVGPPKTQRDQPE